MSTVENLLSIYFDHLFIFCGDFNLPNVSWSYDNHDLIYSSTSDSHINCLPETFAADNFFQINYIFNKSGPLLDLIIVNLNQYMVKSAFISAVPEDSYHPALSIDFILVTNIPQIDSPHCYFNFRKVNYSLINTFLLFFNWLVTFSNLDATSASYTLFNALHLSILQHDPNVKYSRSNFLYWFYKELIDLVFQKRKAHAIFEFTNNPNDYQNFSFLRAKDKYLTKQRQSIPMTVFFNGLTSKNNNEVVDFISKHFNAVYSMSFVNYIPKLTRSLIHDLPSNCFFDISDIESNLSRLKRNNSIGQDRISANYKPIIIISHIGKLFESLVLSCIRPAVNQIIVSEQHGFRLKRSVNTCNLVFTDYAFDAFANKNEVDVIYTDFSKPSVLIKILASSVFGEPLLSWFSSHLSDRKQFVKIFGIKSQVLNTPSEVPQGGYLSPLLFTLFINDIKKVIHRSKFLLFADDLKLFLEIRFNSPTCNLSRNSAMAKVLQQSKLIFWYKYSMAHKIFLEALD
ncbi:uncharacterized protein LOC112686596 [Sipha flava]|uniref:Uncharacterized protein LOC112686596 n=1 Tax=Sipha flava TaxID=143950 RepID=A0A8B8FVA2_9HEMI|nr:uncharacterized protein LOC112686596 [Sipha flava]